ncbi:hypothetical protein [Streptomyces laurentii]|uniref:hypothetical protein n=1 Tax=Streptomyces laurentii TaxID=39478 RepID=UPI00367D54E7
MTDPVTTAVPALLAAASTQGPGNTLRIVLLVSMVGGALLAWFLLRGYRQGGTDAEADTPATTAARTTAPASSDASGTPAEAPETRTGNGPTDANA